MPARFLLALLVALVTGDAAAQVRLIEVLGPRPFGYFIGDVIRLQVDLVLDEPFTLQPGSLPKPRPVAYWLDLKSVAVDDRGRSDGQHRYRLLLDYQTFYAPLEPRELTIPGFSLAATDGTRRVEADVPAWSFLMSPLREIMPRGGGGAIHLRNDAGPMWLPVRRWLVGAAASGLGSALLLGLLAYHRAWRPFAGRRKRPFAHALHTARRAFRSGSSAEAYRAGLLSLHRAFDATAGRAVLADDLPSFLKSAPAFGPLGPEISRFFRASRRAFFGADAMGAEVDLPRTALLDLGRRLAEAERGAS
ncbi:nonribosomal peptide synthetase MxaA [Mesorhizobium sp. RMAD-H1]|uniref:nonribosomal peptide synthetase MxaA n=1 Tax=Mesorhizobium sp. RMAD-H1 TaxID=2587065 RepID=UPI001843AE1B|nr:nonribosomal peptide synthetase MxaA [Mesorhizobium sp. RMAD-H1]MBB2974068.1 mxaA protein [Mesorhizobium sp. RMAD-H1]